jgi:hypothetical protein
MKKLQFLILLPLLFMFACSNDEGDNTQVQNNQSHILKAQKQALEKSKIC